MKKVFEERIFDKSGRLLHPGFGKEFHNLLVDLVKRNRQAKEKLDDPNVNAHSILMNDAKAEDDIPTLTTQDHIEKEQLERLWFGSAISRSQ